MDHGPSRYEMEALEQIRVWKRNEMSLLRRIWRLRNWPSDKMVELVTSRPLVRKLVDRTIGELVGRLQDLARWSVSRDSVYQRFADAGLMVHQPADVHGLDLKQIDEVLEQLGKRYRTLATIEGAATGLLGIAGISADIVALVALNQRVIGEVATYCGIDIEAPQERLFAATILGYASSPTELSKRAALVDLTQMERETVAEREVSAADLELCQRSLRLMARALGVRLTRRRVWQMIPGVGAVIGARLSEKFTRQVFEAAYHLYRERFLAGKYGADLIEALDPELARRSHRVA
jgi:hypothetical protein